LASGLRQTILAYHIGSLGDAIVTMPALRATRRRFPDAKIVLLTNTSRSASLATTDTVIGGSGLVDEFVSYDVAKTRTPGAWLKLIRRLRPYGATVGVYLAPTERLARSVTRDRWFFRLCGARTLFGFHAFDSAELHPRGPDGRPASVPHEAIRKLERLARDGWIADASVLDPPFFTWTPEEHAAADAWLAPRRRPGARLVAVAPATTLPSKTWPFDRFVALGHRLLTAGVDLVVVGGPSDAPQGEALVRVWGAGHVAAGALPLRASAALLNRCAFSVGVDSGSTHLAAAAGTRCVTIAADRDQPGQWSPLGHGHVIVRESVACGGCYATECPEPGHPCLSRITVDRVWQAMREGGLV